MNTNQIGNGDEGVNVSPRSPVDAGGSAEFARLLREGSALLADAANFAERLGQERENVVGGGVYAFEAIYALKTAPSASAEWGDPIAVDGKRPEWFRQSDHGCIAVVGKGTTWEERQETDENTIPDVDDWDWPMIDVVQLPASHPYYLATSRGFTYWPGGDSAPADWNGGDVLTLDGKLAELAFGLASRWQGRGDPWSVIGYRRKPEAGPSCPHIGMSCKGVVRVPCAECDRVITFRDGVQTDEGDGEAVEFIGYSQDAAPADPRAPLMVEVENAATMLRDYRASGKWFAALEGHAALLERLSAALIAQDKRFLQARTYDDERREAARAILAQSCYDAEHSREREIAQGRIVDAVATALGLQRACNNPAT